MKRVVVLVILLGALGAYWWFTTRTEAAGSATDSVLVGSGLIEAETVAITAELGGRVTDLTVGEGDEVSAGQVLAELDQATLLAQQAQLEAALVTAQANLLTVSAPPRPEEVAVAQAQLAQAEAAREGAKAVWQAAQHLAQRPRALQVQLSQAQAQATSAAAQIELAQVGVKQAEISAEAAGRNQSNHAGLVQSQVAQQQLQANQTGLALAQTAAEGAEQQVRDVAAMAQQPLQLIAQANAAAAAYGQAEAAVQAAQANLSAVSAGATAEEIAVARTQVAEAEAALVTLQAQLSKLTLTAPRAGLINQKLINVGELAKPGTTLLTLSDLDRVDLKIYIPETQIGQVQLGQKARVLADAFPGEPFEGYVSFISPQAEFTPRNVQSQEERVNLVFAVKIHLDNPQHRLKPGMPADAELLAEVAPLPSPTAAPSLTATATPSPTPPPALATPTRPAAVTSPGPAETAESTAVLHAEVLAFGLRVRSGPGMTYPVVANLAQGQVVPVLNPGSDSGWLQVQLPDQKGTGWIAANPNYVTVSEN